MSKDSESSIRRFVQNPDIEASLKMLKEGTISDINIRDSYTGKPYCPTA